MKRAGFLLIILGVVLIGALGTMGLAASDTEPATATITVAESTTLTVVTNSLTFAVGAFDTSGTPIDGDITLNARTNKKDYFITAAANAANFSTVDGDDTTIARTQLDVYESSDPAGFVDLPFGSTVEVVTGGTKTGPAGVDHTVDFQFAPTGNEAAGTYTLVVNFILTAN